MIKKENYAAPATEVLELRLEGVIATSDPNVEIADEFGWDE